MLVKISFIYCATQCTGILRTSGILSSLFVFYIFSSHFLHALFLLLLLYILIQDYFLCEYILSHCLFKEIDDTITREVYDIYYIYDSNLQGLL